MDLTLKPEEEAFRDELRAWLGENVPKPFAGDAMGPEHVEYLRAWQRRLYDGGFCGITWPEQYGGRGATPVEEAIYVEELARAGAPNVLGVVGLSLVGPTIIAAGTEAQKERYLEPMLSGEEIWCQGFSEPGSGSDLASLSTRAEADGDGFVVHGRKVWTGYAHVADGCLLLARTGSGETRHEGITCFLVDMKSPGIAVRPLRMMTGESTFNEVCFDGVRVPGSQVLGKVGGGFEVAITTLLHERAHLGAPIRIMMARFLETLIRAARQLPRPGGGTAATDPLARQKIAQAHLELEVFRMTSERALSKLTQGGVPGPEGSILKLFWSELNQRTTHAAMEIAGPFGQLWGDGAFGEHFGQISYAWLRSRGNTLEAGTSEVQRNIVAERILGLPKSY